MERIIDLDAMALSSEASKQIEGLGSQRRAAAEEAAKRLVDIAMRARSREALAKIACALRERGFTDELRRVTVKLRMAWMPVDDAKNLPKPPKRAGKEAGVPQKLARE